MEKWILAAILARLFYLRGINAIDFSKKSDYLNGIIFMICLVCLYDSEFLKATFLQQVGYIGFMGLLISASITDYYTYTLSFWDECLVSAYWVGLCLCTRFDRLYAGLLVCSMIGIIAAMLTYWKKEPVFGEGDYLIIFCIFLVFGWSRGLCVLWLASSVATLYLLFQKKKRLPFVPFLGISSLLVFLFS